MIWVSYVHSGWCSEYGCKYIHLAALPSGGISFVEPHIDESLVGYRQPCQPACAKLNIYASIFFFTLLMYL